MQRKPDTFHTLTDANRINTNTSNQTLRFPRTLHDAGWSHGGAEWAGKEDGGGWAAMIGWATVGVVVMWLFFVVVLGWTA